MGKSSINGPFSMAMLGHNQRVFMIGSGVKLLAASVKKWLLYMGNHPKMAQWIREGIWKHWRILAAISVASGISCSSIASNSGVGMPGMQSQPLELEIRRLFPEMPERTGNHPKSSKPVDFSRYIIWLWTCNRSICMFSVCFCTCCFQCCCLSPSCLHVILILGYWPGSSFATKRLQQEAWPVSFICLAGRCVVLLWFPYFQ